MHPIPAPHSMTNGLPERAFVLLRCGSLYIANDSHAKWIKLMTTHARHLHFDKVITNATILAHAFLTPHRPKAGLPSKQGTAAKYCAHASCILNYLQIFSCFRSRSCCGILFKSDVRTTLGPSVQLELPYLLFCSITIILSLFPFEEN